MEKTQVYKRTMAGTVGAGMGTLINASERTYCILEFKTTTKFHKAGESEKIIVDQIELGRDSMCQIRFDASCETVSRKHAAIVRKGDGWNLIPLSKTNATFVNGQSISGEQMLNSGDEIRLSAKGPIIGFIVPQGAKGLVKSIAMTERLKLFRNQALRPYKTGIVVLSIVLIVAIVGLSSYIYMQGEELEELGSKLKEQTEKISEQANQLNLQAAKVKEAESRGRELLEEVNQTKRNAIQAQVRLDSLTKLSGVTDSRLKEAREDVIKAQDAYKVISEKARAEAAAADSVKKSFEHAQTQMLNELQIMKKEVTEIQGKLDKAEGDKEALQEELERLKGKMDDINILEYKNDTSDIVDETSIVGEVDSTYIEVLDSVMKELEKVVQDIDSEIKMVDAI